MLRLPYKARDVKQQLRAKGFTEEKDHNHFYYYLHYGDKRTSIFTKISHNATDIDDTLCSQMAKQVRLRNRQFSDLIECSLKYEGYIAILVEAKILRPPQKPIPSR